jgi:hypothetical protein
MRPPSIVLFERLFLASLALSVVNFVLGYDAMLAELDRQPGMRQLDLGAEIAVGTMVISLAIYLLLWFFIARKASVVAKWILTIFTAFGVVAQVYRVATVGFAIDVNAVLGIAYYALAIAAVVYLFKPDAEAWFKGEKPADPAAFD